MVWILHNHQKPFWQEESGDLRHILKVSWLEFLPTSLSRVKLSKVDLSNKDFDIIIFFIIALSIKKPRKPKSWTKLQKLLVQLDTGFYTFSLFGLKKVQLKSLMEN